MHDKIIGLGCFNKTIEYDTGMRAITGIWEQPVFPPNHELFYGSLCAIIINTKPAIL